MTKLIKLLFASTFLYAQSCSSNNTVTLEYAHLVWRNDNYLNNIRISDAPSFQSSKYFRQPLYEVTKKYSKISKVTSRESRREKEIYLFNEDSMLIKSIHGENTCNYKYKSHKDKKGITRYYTCLGGKNEFLTRRVQFYNKKGFLIREENYNELRKMVSYRSFDYKKNIVKEYKKGIVKESRFDIDKLWKSRHVD